MILIEPEDQRLEIDDSDDESCNIAGFDHFSFNPSNAEEIFSYYVEDASSNFNY
jgi:hypothetical protein